MCEVEYIFVFQDNYFRNKRRGEELREQAWLSDKRAMLGTPSWVISLFMALMMRFEGSPSQVDANRKKCQSVVAKLSLQRIGGFILLWGSNVWY